MDEKMDKDEIQPWETEEFRQKLKEQMKRSMEEGHWLPPLTAKQEEKR